MTGFLDAGKTTFLLDALNRPQRAHLRTLCISLERGEETFECAHRGTEFLYIPYREWEADSALVAERVADAVEALQPHQVWVEYNGIASMERLYALLETPRLAERVTLQKVVHVVHPTQLETVLGRTGAALPEQLAASDLIVWRSPPTRETASRIRKTVRALNPGVRFVTRSRALAADGLLEAAPASPIRPFAFAVGGLLLALLAWPLWERAGVPMNMLINLYLGILLQALPFLILGVLLSSLIHVFIPRALIERRFPQSTVRGMLVALVAGFFLPVCDCASIPIFRSLVQKGVPLPAAVTFVMASPVINPVVILSTWYAFAGNPVIVGGRVLFGIATALLIGLSFGMFPPKKSPLAGTTLREGLLCGCGCLEDVGEADTLRAKFGIWLRHAQAEFFDVGRYLLIGIFFSVLFQAAGRSTFGGAQSGSGMVVSTVFLMTMAFLLSLCSSSDAVIGRSLANAFPMSAVMGFLVFGPMIDIKNVLLLSAGFERRFVVRLSLTAFLASLVVVSFAMAGGGI